jgi:hypothetical protein
LVRRHGTLARTQGKPPDGAIDARPNHLMKFAEDRPYANPEAAARKLIGIIYCNNEVGRRKYSAYTPTRKKNVKEPRRPLPCWIYGKLYQARNHFLHGNRVSIKTLSPTNVQTGLFWLAPSLYRLALSSFLDLAVEKGLPYWLSDDYERKPKLRAKRLVYDRQSMIERALLRIRKKKV